MRPGRLLILLLAALMLASTAGSAQSADTAPTGLHGFLLRADEPASTSFSRTPSFAWNPVPGALSYQFQLSLGDAFRDNSVIFEDDDAAAPVEAPAITLPWITGSPHALYARVRAVTPDGTTPWSANFGFDMVPPPPPTPLSSYPGLLRWSPVEGAMGYQVWLVDAHKIENSTTNTLDEREFYTFHQTQSWTGTVRWRIRALRITMTQNGTSLANGMPATEYGAWSPIYTSTNPAVKGGPISLVGTVSDVFSNGSSTSPAHRLMPGFLWTGNQALDGTSAELYRVYIFTDKQCLNRVYTSAIVGSPAYAPRPFGPLALPNTAAAIGAARSAYLPDGTEPASYTYDGDQVTTSESLPDATPTTSPPGNPGGGPSSSGGSSPSTGGTAPSSGSGSSDSTFTFQGRTGAPIDLWDTNWPQSGYYWTVVAVAPESEVALATTVGPGGGTKGSVTLSLTSTAGLNVGDAISIGSGPTVETDMITAISGNTVTLANALSFAHGDGEQVARLGGQIVYQDLELPQDACAAGRVMRFGKESEPSLVSSGVLFASGLSNTGRLTSAAQTTAFYGQPVVSWTPALGAEAYEVQWSKSQYPFNAVTLANGSAGTVTASTSVVFPKELGPGTWWYRVRGFDYSLPTGAQQMSWSTPAKLVVAQPKFSIVGAKSTKTGTKTTAKKKTTAAATVLRTKSGTGFTLGIPTTWKPAHGNGFAYADANIMLSEHSDLGRGSQSMAAWASTLKLDASPRPATSLVTLPAGTVVRLAFAGSIEYHVDAGSSSDVFVFQGTAAHLVAEQATIAKIMATLRLTS